MEFEDNVKKSFDRVKGTTDGLQSAINSCEKRLDKQNGRLSKIDNELTEQGEDIENLFKKIDELHDVDVEWKKKCTDVLKIMADGNDVMGEKLNGLCDVLHMTVDYINEESRNLKCHGIWFGCGMLLASMVFSTVLYFI